MVRIRPSLAGGAQAAVALLAILLYSVLLYYCKVARKPPKHRWSCISAVGQPLVELMVTEHENDKGEKAEKTVVIHLYKFRSTTKGAIDAFVEESYKWYIGELKKQEDNSRYLYEMQLNGKAEGGGDEGSASRVFKRYRLADPNPNHSHDPTPSPQPHPNPNPNPNSNLTPNPTL